jgi:DNA (cytosine-5)-methyltransferase 1
MTRVLDLFAGPGGWSEGLRMHGVETDAPTCETARAAGHERVQADVAALDPMSFAPVDGLIASPPCQAWSMAGKGGGRRDVEHVVACCMELAAGQDTRAVHAAKCEDARSMLVVEPLRWALTLQPKWIALEQVPPVLELWTLFAQLLEAKGWRVWAGILEAERYGVPQTRERAIMLGHRDRPVFPPPPTHQRYVAGEPQRHDMTFDGEILPWVSMAEALGWGMTARPYPTVACSSSTGGPDMEKVGGSAGRKTLYDEQDAGRWQQPDTTVQTTNFTAVQRDADGKRSRAGSVPYERTVEAPAPTLTGEAGSWIVNTGRDWKEGGSREDAQTFDAEQRPAPAIDGKGRWHVEYRRGGDRLEESTPIDAPAPTVTSRADRWQIKPDEPYEGCARRGGVCDCNGRPCGLDLLAAEEGGEWQLRVTNDRPNATKRDATEPAQTLAFGHEQPVWERKNPPAALRAGTHENDVTRRIDEPAPTMRFGERVNSVSWVENDTARGDDPASEWAHDRPATTVCGRPDVFPPGHRVNAEDVRAGRGGQRRSGAGAVVAHNRKRSEATAIRVSIVEAGVLQSFPADYPWQGNKSDQFRQVGNAMPPLLARAVLAQLVSA